MLNYDKTRILVALQIQQRKNATDKDNHCFS